jgi:hypothetical protein
MRSPLLDRPMPTDPHGGIARPVLLIINGNEQVAVGINLTQLDQGRGYQSTLTVTDFDITLLRNNLCQLIPTPTDLNTEIPCAMSSRGTVNIPGSLPHHDNPPTGRGGSCSCISWMLLSTVTDR